MKEIICEPYTAPEELESYLTTKIEGERLKHVSLFLRSMGLLLRYESEDQKAVVSEVVIELPKIHLRALRELKQISGLPRAAWVTILDNVAHICVGHHHAGDPKAYKVIFCMELPHDLDDQTLNILKANLLKTKRSKSASFYASESDS